MQLITPLFSLDQVISTMAVGTPSAATNNPSVIKAVNIPSTAIVMAADNPFIMAVYNQFATIESRFATVQMIMAIVLAFL